MAAAPVGIGDVIAGKYIVERVIGEGGMGVVLAARHRELEQRVAIKFLLAEIAQQGMAAERFRREARAAARIRGEHVCRVLDVGTLESGIPFMVMEYLEGRDLSSELDERGKLPYFEAVGFVLQACEALAEAHASGVIHRDLKPANLFLESRGDGSRRIKVLDFGVSKSLIDAATPGHGVLTQTSSLVGSPLYMSPEQLDSARDVDARTDVWALGVVLYELIAGRTPFHGESIPQLVTAVLHETPRPLAAWHVDVPPGLDAVLLKAMSKQRKQRYASVSEFVNALMPYAPAESAGTASRVSRLLSMPEPVTGVTPQPDLPTGRTPVAPEATSTPLAWGTAPRRGASGLWVGALLLLAVGLSVGGYLYFLRAERAEPPAAATQPVAAPSETPQSAASVTAPEKTQGHPATSAKTEVAAPAAGAPATPKPLAPSPAPPQLQAADPNLARPKPPGAVVPPAPARLEARPPAPVAAPSRPAEADRPPEVPVPERAPASATPGSSISDFGGRR